MSHRQVAVAVPAKVNVRLSVGGVREDGYHALATVYQAVGVFDRLTARPAEPGAGVTVEVTSDNGAAPYGVPLDEANLAVRAAHHLARAHDVLPDVALHLHKAIPVAGGMAGGSADAAAALLACDTLWATRTPRERLLELAAELGSDVPFALLGGTALGAGRGELVTPVITTGEYWWVLAESDAGLATPAVYRELDRQRAAADRPAPEPWLPDALMEALRRGDPVAVADHLGNDLEGPALALRPGLADVLAAGDRAGTLASTVSGSGPTCLFLCRDREHAASVAVEVAQVAGGPVTVVSGPVPGARVVG